MEKFKPSIDWSHEVVTSTLWILAAWAISAAVILVIAALLVRHTAWGRRFWRVTGDYFTDRDSAPVWAVLGVLLASVIVEVRLQVLLSYYNNDLYSALQVAFQGTGSGNAAQRNSGIHGFWVALATFCILAALRTGRIVFDTYLTQRFLIRWRVWFTDRLTGDWLDGHAYYRAQFTDWAVDNPDQRIQQDIDTFTAGVGTGPNAPSNYSQTMLVFRCGQRDRVDGLVHRHSVAIVRAAGGFRRRDPEGLVLHRRGVRSCGDTCCLPDRSSVDPAEFSERADQRGIPLRACAPARRRLIRRLLPG